MLDEKTDVLLEYQHLFRRSKHKEAWGYSFGNETGRLDQGVPRRNIGTNTIYFVYKNEIPDDRWKDMPSGKIVCNVQSQKDQVF